MNALSTAVNWEFLQEPMWAWFVFLGAMILLMGAWKDILSWIE